MRFQKIFLVAVPAVALAALAYLYSRPEQQLAAPTVASIPATAAASDAILANPLSKGKGVSAMPTETGSRPAGDLSYNTASFKGATLPERLAAMSARRNGRAFDPQQVADALKSDIAWESNPAIGDQLALSDAERKDGREFVRVNPLKIEALMKGDELSLPIKQMKSSGPVRMLVDEVEQGIDGAVTWHGHLKDFGSENQVSFTRGDTLIVGGVSKPDKNFVVQIDGETGWIVDGFTIFKGRHDAIKPPNQEGGAGHSHGVK